METENWSSNFFFHHTFQRRHPQKFTMHIISFFFLFAMLSQPPALPLAWYRMKKHVFCTEAPYCKYSYCLGSNVLEKEMLRQCCSLEWCIRTQLSLMEVFILGENKIMFLFNPLGRNSLYSTLFPIRIWTGVHFLLECVILFPLYLKFSNDGLLPWM